MSLCAGFLLTACGKSTDIEIGPAVNPRVDPIDAGLSQTPARPKAWPVPTDASLIPEAVVTYRHSTDRATGNACVDQFIAYRDSVEERDAGLRGGEAAER